MAKDRWVDLCATGWSAALGLERRIDCVVDVPWRDWGCDDSLWVCEEGDEAYSSGKRWRLRSASIPVFVLSPSRRIATHVLPSDSDFGAPRYVTLSASSGVECVYSRAYYGVRDEVYASDADQLMLSDSARKLWDDAMPKDGGLRWERIDIVSRQVLMDMRGGKDLPYS